VRRQPRRPATAHRRRCRPHGLAEGPAGPGSTDPSPCGDGAGVAPAQPLPAAEPTSRHRQGRLLLGPCRPSSSPWPATADSAPPPVARCRAPGTAGRRGCRTAVRRYGTPGNANRRSAGVHGRASSGLGQQLQLPALSTPEPGARAISPGRRVFRPLTRCHRPWPGSGSDQPTSRRARPSRSRIAVPPYSRRSLLAVLIRDPA
jgi:hypothetical protein